MVIQRHQSLAKTRGEQGANNYMRVLRAIYAFAIDRYDDGTGRPVISHNLGRASARPLYLKPRTAAPRDAAAYPTDRLFEVMRHSCEPPRSADTVRAK